MRTRLIRYRSARFVPRTNDYTYPQLRTIRPRVSQREQRAVDWEGREVGERDPGRGRTTGR